MADRRFDLRSLFTGALVAIALLSVGAHPTAARDAAPSTNGTCLGQDMMAELAATDADAHRAVLLEAAELANSDKLLWKIEKSGLPPSYLFGTIHLTDARVTTLSPAVRTALDQSKRLVLEIADLSDEVLAGAMADAATLYLYNDGQSLKGVLSEPDFQKVRSIINAAGMPKDMADLIRPWFVSTLLSVSPCERRRMAAGKSVLDKRLGEEAKARDLPVTGLETVAEQLNALASIPENEQVEMLKVSLLYADRTDDMIETLLQLYTQRRMGAAMPFQKVLARKAGAPPTIFDGFQRILLVDRNARMAKAADALLAEGGVFMAVGALHLPGSTGLVDLLRAQGYTLTAIE